MPQYEYHCELCKHEFEKFRTIAERYDVTCPQCGAPKRNIQLMIRSCTFHLKGQGWAKDGYVTDKNRADYWENKE